MCWRTLLQERGFAPVQQYATCSCITRHPTGLPDRTKVLMSAALSAKPSPSLSSLFTPWESGGYTFLALGPAASACSALLSMFSMLILGSFNTPDFNRGPYTQRSGGIYEDEGLPGSWGHMAGCSRKAPSLGGSSGMGRRGRASWEGAPPLLQAVCHKLNFCAPFLLYHGRKGGGEL